MKDPAITGTIAQAFSVRWSGRLRRPYPAITFLGVYRLRCDNCQPPGTPLSAHIFLDDNPVLDDETPLRRSAHSFGKRTLRSKRVTRTRCALNARRNYGSVGLEFVWPAAGGTVTS